LTKGSGFTAGREAERSRDAGERLDTERRSGTPGGSGADVAPPSAGHRPGVLQHLASGDPDFWEAFGWNAVEVRPGPPSSDAIDRMDAVLRWLLCLEPDEVRLVWLRAEGVRWKSSPTRSASTARPPGDTGPARSSRSRHISTLPVQQNRRNKKQCDRSNRIRHAEL
jgi:hypothetical protein